VNTINILVPLFYCIYPASQKTRPLQHSIITSPKQNNRSVINDFWHTRSPFISRLFVSEKFDMGRE